MRFTTALALSAACAAILIAREAMALPASGMAPPASPATALPLVQVHGCHFDLGPGMVPDRENGPHYHNRQCAVVRVGPQGGHAAPPPRPRYEAPPPPARYDNRSRGYDERPRGGGYDERRRGGGYYQGDGYARGYGPPPRYPICRERCRYVGPFKQCRTECN